MRPVARGLEWAARTRRRRQAAGTVLRAVAPLLDAAPPDRPILIVPDDPDDVPEVVTHLLRVGFDDVQGYLEGGLGDWETNGFELGRLATTSVHGLAAGSSSAAPTD